jgi:hypothetical protein
VFRVLSQEGDRFIRGAVIRHYEFEWENGLPGEAVKLRCQIAGTVVGGHRD